MFLMKITLEPMQHVKLFHLQWSGSQFMAQKGKMYAQNDLEKGKDKKLTMANWNSCNLEH